MCILLKLLYPIPVSKKMEDLYPDVFYIIVIGHRRSTHTSPKEHPRITGDHRKPPMIDGTHCGFMNELELPKYLERRRLSARIYTNLPEKYGRQ